MWENDPYSSNGVVKQIVKDLTRNINADFEKLSKEQLQLCLPIISSEDIQVLCKNIEDIFSKESSLIEIEPPLIVVGDLHGHYLDLLRTLHEFGLPCNRSYLFLGDLVDRGEFSLETVTLVFALKVLYPKNVHIIRGNHEFDFLCSRSGFLSEIEKVYQNSKVYDMFLSAFGMMPLAAVIQGDILCVHGGIGPSIEKIEQIKEIQRPIYEFCDGILDSLIWSDPSDSILFYEPSSRGSGYFFGERSTQEFLQKNNLKMMIRAHECVHDGFQYMFDGKLLTVFGASNYCGLVSNSSAVLIIDHDGTMTTHQFSPLNYLKRESVMFLSFCSLDKHRKKGNIKSSASLASVSPMPKPKIERQQLTPNTNIAKSFLPKLRPKVITRSLSKVGMLTDNSILLGFKPL